MMTVETIRAVDNLSGDTLRYHRYNLLKGDWILVSPHRAGRPWHGQEKGIVFRVVPAYDQGCCLWSVNRRAGGL